MPVTNWNRKILDLKRWTVLPTPAPAATLGGAVIISSRLNQQRQLYVTSNTVAHLYYPFEDGWVQLPNPGLAGTFGPGVCGTASAVGPTGTATAGSTTTLTTNLTLARSLAGYQIHITGGPGAGDIRTIASNTIGANGVITVTSAFSTAITASSTYRLLTPRWYVLGAGTLAAGSFRFYDFALNTWTSLSITGLPASWGFDGKMVATPSYGDNGVPVQFTPSSTQTATAGGASTLTNAGKAWTVNQWANFQIRITGGTGAGQIRTIASNTATVITVSSAWNTVPDTTSTYVIEGNDDFIYLMGNNAVTLYRYSISANAWTTLTPAVARASVATNGMSGHWVFGVQDPLWTNENAIINGRRIYSLRGNSQAAIDYYDIAANTWVNAISYAPAAETFHTGSKFIYSGDFLYLQKEATGRWFRFSFVDSAMVGFTANTYPQGTPVVGDTAFDVIEPETGIRFLYMILNTSTVHMRCMII